MLLTSSATTYHQHCDAPGCGLQQYGLLIAQIRTTPDVLVLPACPGCGAVEVLRRHHAPHELGTAVHPGSLVGTSFADTGGVVTAHQVGYHLEPHTLALRQRIHDLSQHHLLVGS